MCSCLQRPLGSFVYGAHFPGEDNNSQVFPKKGLKFLIPGIWQTGPTQVPHGRPWNDAVTLTADARDERCEVRVQVWPCVDPSVKLSCARLSNQFWKNTLPARKKENINWQNKNPTTKPWVEQSGTETGFAASGFCFMRKFFDDSPRAECVSYR